MTASQRLTTLLEISDNSSWQHGIEYGHQCDNGWSCPICTPLIRDRHRDEVHQLAQHHLLDGGTVTLKTLTLPWPLSQPLADVVAELPRAVRGRQFRSAQRKHGVTDISYAVTIRIVDAYVWKVQLNIIGLSTTPRTGFDLRDVSDDLFNGLRQRIMSRLGVVLDQDRDFTATAVDIAGLPEAIDQLVGTDCDHSPATLEYNTPATLIRPMQLLDLHVSHQAIEAADRKTMWVDFVGATYDHAPLGWSGPLRAAMRDHIGQHQMV